MFLILDQHSTSGGFSKAICNAESEPLSMNISYSHLLKNALVCLSFLIDLLTQDCITSWKYWFTELCCSFKCRHLSYSISKINLFKAPPISSEKSLKYWNGFKFTIANTTSPSCNGNANFCSKAWILSLAINTASCFLD